MGSNKSREDAPNTVASLDARTAVEEEDDVCAVLDDFCPVLAVAAVEDGAVLAICPVWSYRQGVDANITNNTPHDKHKKQ